MKKLKLKDLEVGSFVTNLSHDSKQTIKGGDISLWKDTCRGLTVFICDPRFFKTNDEFCFFISEEISCDVYIDTHDSVMVENCWYET